MKQTKKKTLHRQLPTTGTNTVDVNRTVDVADGDYSIRVISSSSDGANRAGNTSDIVMSYNYLDDSNMNAFIGDNGFVLRGNKDNYFHLSFLNSAMTLKAKGNVDMPGVLAKARIDSNWSISKKWGAYTISQVTNTTTDGANKRVYHDVGHDQYSAICTPYGRGSIVEVIREDADSLYLYATGGFNIELVGNNR